MIIFAVALSSVAASAQARKLPGPFPNVPWAFYVPSKVQPAQGTGLRHVPGSSRAYTQDQIDNLMDPPDWFPDEHPPMPRVVAQGAPGGVFACASCHLVSGLGHPESANLAGLSAAYVERQLLDFKNGCRPFALAMPEIAKSLSAEDAKKAIMWLSQLPLKPWQKVVETDRVPKAFVDRHLMRLPLPGRGDEPIGDRIIELPQDPALAKSRDPNSGFIAYVPKGSVEKGKDLAVTGGHGKTYRCAICHGPALAGLGEVPLIAGHDPVYLFRQLYCYKHGLRKGSLSALMMQVVANLSFNDMLDLAAYLGSLSPPARASEASAATSQSTGAPKPEGG